MNPWLALLRSRKFWLVILDVGSSLVLFFASKYAAPVVAEDVKFVVAALQVPFAVIIGAIAYEDGKNVEAGFNPVTRSYIEVECVGDDKLL